MTIEKVKLTDFTSEELKAVCLALGVALRTAITLTPQEIEHIQTFRAQCINAAAQRNFEEKIIQN